jgi:cell division protein ZipA
LGELRWILLGLGVAGIILIWWWTARRGGQARGNAELRESSAAPAHTFGSLGTDPAPSPERRPAESREWGVPPLEPLSIRTADLERVPALDQPMLAQADPLELTVEFESQGAGTAPMAAAAAPGPARAAAALPAVAVVSAPIVAGPAPAKPRPIPEPRVSAPRGDRSAADPVQGPNMSAAQRIVSVRVCAEGEARWPGAALMAALELYGLAYGRYQVYHRKHSDGRSIFCVASLVEPGSFDIAHMAQEEFRGVTVFAVLPGPLAPLPTLDAMLATARELARELSGVVQDSKGAPFSAQRAAALREDIARFQSTLR